MSFLGKLFGGGKTKPVDQPAVALECPHTALVPKWDNVHDMGIEDKATGYECDSCHKAFTPEEARSIRETLAERLRLPTSNT